MTTTLATWDITRGVVFVPLEVVGGEAVAVGDETVDAWKLLVDVGRYRVTRWISRATRKELRWSVTMEGRQMVGEPR